MSHTHYYQEDTDEGLKIAALLNQLIESPGALSKGMGLSEYLAYRHADARSRHQS